MQQYRNILGRVKRTALIFLFDFNFRENGEIGILSCTAIEQTAVPNCFVYFYAGSLGQFLVSENKVSSTGNFLSK